MRHTPLTISAAGMMATAAFFAPLISTSPCRRLPPWILYFSKQITSQTRTERGHRPPESVSFHT